MIDFNKPVQTRDGRKVRILCTDANSAFPVVGLIIDGGEFDTLETWDSTGCCYEKRTADEDDLINVPERVERWVNVYGHDLGAVRSSRAEADKQSSSPGRSGVIRITYEDGKPVAVALEDCK